MTIQMPPSVRRKAVLAGRPEWADALPGLVAELESAWSVRVGRAYPDGTEAYVAAAHPTDPGGAEAVLKIVVPRAGGHAEREITTLLRDGGAACARLLRHDRARGALLLERLGPSMAGRGLAAAEHRRLLAGLAARLWQRAPDLDLPTGAQQASELVASITRLWAELGRPCSARAVDHARRCAERRAAAHDPGRTRLLHGDVHAWNALARGDGWALVDPDGLHAEPEYDLGVIAREDPVALLAERPGERARHLAALTGRDAVAIEEWAAAERVSTGLLAVAIGLQPVGAQMLRAAEAVARAA